MFLDDFSVVLSCDYAHYGGILIAYRTIWSSRQHIESHSSLQDDSGFDILLLLMIWYCLCYSFDLAARYWIVLHNHNMLICVLVFNIGMYVTQTQRLLGFDNLVRSIVLYYLPVVLTWFHVHSGDGKTQYDLYTQSMQMIFHCKDYPTISETGMRWSSRMKIATCTNTCFWQLWMANM